ncbi:hypothetical protein FRC19_008315 [Serendipita sp. 401]|nr:hypothetical protein FRC19_008315 [Serendipita sp. 401]
MYANGSKTMVGVYIYYERSKISFLLGYSDFSRYGNERARSPDRRRNTLEDPTQRDTLSSFKHFSEWFRSAHPDLCREDQAEDSSENASPDKKDNSIVKLRYDEYRRQFIRKQYKLMFDYHRKFAWFAEKYDTGERFADMRDRVRKQGWDGTINHFVNDLEAGQYDPAALGAHDSMPATSAENEDRKEDFDNDGDDLMQGGIPISVPPTQSTRKPGIGEAIAAPRHPQLMVKTLPPDIGRLKLEEVLSTFSGFKYVAIGDPVQKRQFYRSAWIAFEDNNDVSKAQGELETKKIDNFRLPVAITSDPYIAKVRYTPTAANKLPRMEKDLEQAKRLAAVFETQAAELATFKPIFPIGAPLNAEPLKNEDDGENEVAMAEDIDPARGTKAVEERIDKVASETLDTDENGKPDHAKKVALSLDLYLAYLREAFHCCYYCAVVADHQEELVRKCIKHERREDSSALGEPTNGEAPKPSSDFLDERWADGLDHRLACLIDPASVDPAEYGGTSLEEERSRVTSAHFQREEEGKWRCQICKKLFKATEFVEKHIVNKHAEEVKAQMDEWEIYNNFVLDPQHILPMQSAPLSASGTMQHPPQAFGLPADWRSPYADSSRFSRDSRDNRDRRMGYRGSAPQRRSPSPVQFGRPMRFTMDSSTIPSANWTSGALPAVPGLPAKPVDAMTAATPMQANPVPLLGRISAPLAPPPGAKPDPRSRISYHDLDRVESTDDVALQY